jgi:predicted Ser/Thr protein kinase
MADAPLLHERYRVVRKLGRGAFATVYLAEDLRMGRPVAVKVVEDSADLDGRALREAQAAAKLDHPHIVTVHEVVRETGRTFLFTEYVEGQTLRRLYASRSLPDAQLLEAGIQMCRALEHAHRRGVVHRDIKPENVMVLDGEGVDVRIMDFGVAQLEDLTSITQDGDLVGTLAYMAPEQLEAGSVDAKADVYALSLTLYEGFTGSNPSRGKKAGELLRDASRRVFERLNRSRPDLPVELDEALSLGLEKDPGRRPDAAGLRRMLEQAAKHMPEPVARPSLGARFADAVDASGRRDQLAFAGRHVLAAAFTLGGPGYLLLHIPFYPRSWLVPLMALTAFLSLLAPSWGGPVALLLLAPPIFSFSPGWGVVYLVVAALTFLALRLTRCEWALLLPGVVPLVVSWGLLASGVALALPALAGFFWRRWGPLGGALTGLCLALAAGFSGWERIPYAFTSGGASLLLETRHAVSPLPVLKAVGDLVSARPELAVQAAVFVLLGLPLGRLYRGVSVRSLWVLCLHLAAMFTLMVVLPPVFVGARVDLGAFVPAFLVCAIITSLPAFLVPSGGPDPAVEG